jgi:sec-independent protein translocase protein TatB
VFGLSFGELCVLLIVGVIVLGPKELPRYLRKAGQFAARLRRFAYEMREKSGIDEVLRTEGIDNDIAEIRKLARGEIGGIGAAVRSTLDAARMNPPPRVPAASGSSGTAAPTGAMYAPTQLPDAVPVAVDRRREYPREGADSYGALPDTATVDEAPLPASPLAADALYTRGEAPQPAPTAEPQAGEAPDAPPRAEPDANEAA